MCEQLWETTRGVDAPRGQHQWDAANIPVQKVQSEEKTVPGASQSQKPWAARRCSFRKTWLLPAMQRLQRRMESRHKYTRVSPLLSPDLLPMSLISWTQRSQGQSSPSNAVSPAPESKKQGREEQRGNVERGAGWSRKPIVIWVQSRTWWNPTLCGENFVVTSFISLILSSSFHLNCENNQKL